MNIQMQDIVDQLQAVGTDARLLDSDTALSLALTSNCIVVVYARWSGPAIMTMSPMLQAMVDLRPAVTIAVVDVDHLSHEWEREFGLPVQYPIGAGEVLGFRQGAGVMLGRFGMSPDQFGDAISGWLAGGDDFEPIDWFVR